MPSTIVNPSTGEVVVEMDLCVPMGAAFDLDELMVNFNGEIAQYDATLCPDALNLSDDSFNAIHANKVVLWTNDLPNACYGYFDVVPWYTRLVNAGALGIVNLQTLGQTPGVWHTRFTTEYMRGEGFTDMPPIPLVSCEVTSAEAYVALTSNQAKLVNDRSYPFNSPLNGSFEVDENPWKAQVFDNIIYRIVFQGFIAGVFFVGMIMGIYYMYERVQSIFTKRNIAWRHVLTVPLAALAMEVFCCLVLGVYFAVDGHWAVQDSPMTVLRQTFMGQLGLISMGSSVLIGLGFSDFRQSSKRLRKVTNSSFTTRHRKVIISSSVVLVALEVVSGVSRAISPIIFNLLNALSISIAAVIGVWFAFEAHGFTNILEKLSEQTQGTAIVKPESTLRKFVEHTRKWTLASSLLVVFMVTINLVMSFTPIVWHPDTWAILWYFAVTGRASFSICKVVLCRLPNTQRSSYTPTALDSATGNTADSNNPWGSSNALTGGTNKDTHVGNQLRKTKEDRSGMGSYTGSFDKMGMSGGGNNKKRNRKPASKLTIEEEDLDLYI